MGIFGTSSPFDPVVEKATLDTNTKEDWALILDICDKVTTSSTGPKECLRAIVKRLNNQDPHVILQAITLLDACVSNCGLPFHLEIASRDFEQEFRKLIHKSQERTVKDKLLICLQKWAENEFKSDPQLDLIPSLYGKLKTSGVDFPSDSPHKSKKSGGHHKHKDHSGPSSSVPALTDDADLAKAIELSLKEAQANQQNKSLYPQTSLSGGSSGTVEEKEPRKVRALYDFEAAEENELTFYAGEIVFVTDDTDTNWWHGSNQRGKGLFPANFVSADLSVEPTKFEVAAKKSVQFSEDVEVQSIETEPEVVEIDENRIDSVLHMLHEADPTGEILDPAELGGLEDQVNQMGPLIDQELEKIDRRHAQLTRLGGELVEALNMYHNLMREPMGMGQQPSMPYNMKMGMNVPGPAVSMPHFPPVNGPVQYPSGYPPFDPNSLPYQNNVMMRPPHSAPASNGSGYANQYQSPQSNGPVPQQNNSGPSGSQQNSNPMSIPNSQPGPQQMPQQAVSNQQHHQVGQMPPQQMNMNVSSPMSVQPGPYNQGMIMQHGQPMGMHPQQPQNQMAPQMSFPQQQGGPPQQFGHPPPQVYQQQQPPANAPAV